MDFNIVNNVYLFLRQDKLYYFSYLLFNSFIILIFIYFIICSILAQYHHEETKNCKSLKRFSDCYIVEYELNNRFCYNNNFRQEWYENSHEYFIWEKFLSRSQDILDYSNLEESLFKGKKNRVFRFFFLLCFYLCWDSCWICNGVWN